MHATLLNTGVRLDDWRRFAVSLLFLAAALALLIVPEFAFAAFNGDFAPNEELVTNTDSSLLKWWKAFAGWGLYISVAAFLISVIFMGGKFWLIPVATCLICLFGEMFVTGVKGLAEL